MADPQPAASPLQLSTLAGCRLVIGRYPAFRYDGRGGGGPGLRPAPESAAIRFPPEQLTIPPLNGRTTRFLGLPLPPGLSIAVLPERLEGQWPAAAGEPVELAFSARFRFRVGPAATPLYAPPDLRVACTLSSGRAEGQRFQASGQPCGPDGRARLVGVARIEPCGDPWLDRFLGLPDEALAVLDCRLNHPLTR